MNKGIHKPYNVIAIILMVVGCIMGCTKKDPTLDFVRNTIHPIVIKEIRQDSIIKINNYPSVEKSIEYHNIQLTHQNKKTLQSAFDKGTIIEIRGSKKFGIYYETNSKQTLKLKQRKVSGYFYFEGDAKRSGFYEWLEFNDKEFTPIQGNWFKYEYIGQ